MAYSFSLSPVHRPDMSEILLKFVKSQVTHPPTHPPTHLITGFPAHTVSRWIVIVRNSYSENKKVCFTVHLCRQIWIFRSDLRTWLKDRFHATENMYITIYSKFDFWFHYLPRAIPDLLFLYFSTERHWIIHITSTFYNAESTDVVT